MIKAVVFDFFGVVCSDHYWRFVKTDRQTDSVFRHYADDVNLGEITWPAFVEEIARVTNTSVGEVNKMYQSENIDPRVVALINELHKNYKTGLLTNAHHEFIDDVLNKNHLTQLFDVVVISSRIGLVKPNPNIFEYLIEKLDLKPSEIIYVDDLERHVSAASEAGMKAILYKDFSQFKRELDTALSTA